MCIRDRFRPLSIPLRGYHHSPTEAHRTPGTPPGYINPHQQIKRRRTPKEHPTAYTSPTTPTQHEPKHRHRTRAAIQDYILQQPGRSSRPQGSPNGDPQRAETPPGCNGVALQIEPPTAAHRRHRGQQKTPRAEARSVAPYLFIFNRSAKTTNGKIKIQSKIKSFHPLTEP